MAGDVAMQPLSRKARFVLDRMEPDCQYAAQDLRALVPDASVEGFREIMHELWINRMVERVGYVGWRRSRSAPADRPASVSDHPDIVKPEDLFDYATFGEFFK
jgi:hypothetical protein